MPEVYPKIYDILKSRFSEYFLHEVRNIFYIKNIFRILFSKCNILIIATKSAASYIKMGPVIVPDLFLFVNAIDFLENYFSISRAFRAAFCSASFLLLPLPWATGFSSTYTSTPKVLSCPGPSSEITV